MSTSRKKRRPDPPVALPVGSTVGGFEVRNVLGSGEFGIVYRVYDHHSDADLAVKEYLPPGLAVRTQSAGVTARTPEDAEPFALGLRFFLNEGRLLARFEHPSLVKVHRSWEENGTGYIAMALCTGRNLCETRQARWRSPSENSLRGMLRGLLGAAEQLHRAGVVHRDIAPENILLEPDGRPVLLDVGAPRRVISGRGEAPGPEPRSGYAPIELYPGSASQDRGPWTDLYSLGATLHYLIVGKPPASAPERMADEPSRPLMSHAGPRYSPEFLAVIEWMIAPRPTDRPRTVEAVRAALDGKGLPEHLAPSKRQVVAVRLMRHRRRIVAGVVGTAAAVGAAAIGVWLFRQREEE